MKWISAGVLLLLCGILTTRAQEPVPLAGEGEP